MPARRVRRGRFIVLEGLDGAGTTTQARLLGDRLRGAGRAVHVTAEPSGGPIGSLVRQALSRRVVGGRGQGELDPGALALLFAADRLDHVAAEIAPKLAEGVDVVSDRFTLSSLAYQGLTTGALAWVEAVNARAATPDVTLFLRARAAVALKRRRAATMDPELYEVSDFQRAVARSYDRGIALLRAAGQRVVELDGEAPVEAVADAVWAAVEQLRSGR
ncbi:dTMP kinase [Anaeromyxobacter soli]|uniref:dTMP kinase n=1 Tax=Anaeromyxobacter soli TaxID=2922725 RepID=UPI001FAF6682|nr:dTMP kinase [Anaeromyxobacter sp. SG29]